MSVSFHDHHSGCQLVRLHGRQVGYLLPCNAVSMIDRYEQDVVNLVRAAVEQERGKCSGVNMPPELPEEMFE